MGKGSFEDKVVQVSLVISDKGLFDHVTAFKNNRQLRKFLVDCLVAHMDNPVVVEDAVYGKGADRANDLALNLEQFRLYLAAYSDTTSEVHKVGAKFAEVKEGFERFKERKESEGDIEARLDRMEYLLESMVSRISSNGFGSQEVETAKPVVERVKTAIKEEPLKVEEDIVLDGIEDKPVVKVEAKVEAKPVVRVEDKPADKVEDKPEQESSKTAAKSIVSGLL